jgi:5-methyltetrahydrofolate--homocysteine methyltransferase
VTRIAALTTAIEEGDRSAAVAETRAAIDAGTGPAVILEAMTEAMAEVGRRFSCGQYFVPEMLLSARAMKESMVLLEPRLAAGGVEPEFSAVIGTVKGDLHDIGKNLVATMWRGANIGVVDLGTNVGPAAFVEAARAHGARLVGISAMLTTTMVAMDEAVRALRASGLDVRIMVGGAPVNEAFAEKLGADGFAPDAATAVDVARALVAHARRDADAAPATEAMGASS